MDSSTAEMEMTKESSVPPRPQCQRVLNVVEMSSCATTENASTTDLSATEFGTVERERMRLTSAAPRNPLPLRNVIQMNSCVQMGLA